MRCVRLALAALCLAGAAQAQPKFETPTPRADVKTLDYRLQARALAPGVWVVEGDNADFSVPNGCNIINTGFIATGAGVVVINTGPSKTYGEQLRALIARTTAEPVLRVLNLNLHPDYFLGNQAFADVPRWATATTLAGIQRESASYETNLYRMCGDWMKGTETVLPNRTLEVASGSGTWELGGRRLRWWVLQGHTDSDWVLQDEASGVTFTGGLVFHQRVPTTPHAKVNDWLASLDQLQALKLTGAVVPSHGPVHQGQAGLQGTQQFLRWLDTRFRAWAQEGLEMNDVLRASVPQDFQDWAAFRTEWVRNVAHLYPVYEREALGGSPR